MSSTMSLPDKKYFNIHDDTGVSGSGSLSKKPQIDVKARETELKQVIDKITKLIEKGPLKKQTTKESNDKKELIIKKKVFEEELQFLEDDEVLSDPVISDDEEDNKYIKDLEEKLQELESLNEKQIGTMSIGVWKLKLIIPNQ